MNNIFTKLSYDQELTLKLKRFIQQNNDSLLMEGEVYRAKLLLQRIRYLQDVENLSETKLIWRLHSYTRMSYFDGPLARSSELRNMIVHHMGVYLGVLVEDVKKVSARMTKELGDRQRAAASVMPTPVAAWGPGSSDQFWTDAIKECAGNKMVVRSRLEQDRHAGDVDHKFRDAMLAALDKYLQGAKWWQWTGKLWAEELQKTMVKWEKVEGLSDVQLAMRMLEEASYKSGEGLFRTSKQCRSMVVDSLFGNLAIDAKALEARIKTIMETPDGYIYGAPVAVPTYPDRDEATLQAKLELIEAALGKNATMELVNPVQNKF